MTERGLAHSDGAIACPFVAFEDDRDERSDRPDHRHRCYAESPPAPRAIAHQEAYCLASAFAVCPTFQDWAQREAARTRGAAAGRSAPAGRVAPQPDAEIGDGAAAREVADDTRHAEPAQDDAAVVPADEWRAGNRPRVEEERPAPPLPPRRNPPRDWAAPPPWAAGAGGVAGAGGASGAAAGSGAAASGDAQAPGFLASRSEGRGLAGSAADRLASGESIADRPRERPLEPRPDPVRAQTPPPPPQASEADDELADLVRSSRLDRAEETTRFRSAEDRAAERRSRAARASGDAPAWEEPRRYEAYPTIKARSAPGGLPRIGVMLAALALAALVLFALPGLLGWFGDDNAGGPGAGASPTATVPAETPSPSPTVPPEPTPQVYVIKQGDTLSKVARRFGVTLDALLEANRDRIKNPDRISIGDEIIIPVPTEEE